MITVLGASGFIGSHLVEKLRELDLDCFAPHRDEAISGKDLGHVIYCIGLTADFRRLPFETVEAHVCKLLNVLQRCEFESLLYLSSARLYYRQERSAREDNLLRLDPSHPDHLYDISKGMGESLALNCGKPARVVRLSNVYGDDYTSQNFLPAIIRDAIRTGKVVLQTSLDSERDYVSVSDVVGLLVKIATEGRHRIYNLASGINVSNLEITRGLSEITGCHVETIANAPKITFPQISIDRLKDEFAFQPASVLVDMKRLVELFDRRP